MAPSRACFTLSKSLRLTPHPFVLRTAIAQKHAIRPTSVLAYCALPHQRALSTSSTLHSSSDPPSQDPQPPDYLSEGELKIFNILRSELQPNTLEVQDVSGGCGSMYALDIVSDKFRGLPVIKQHRLVNQVLGEEIKKWHGVQLKTREP